MRRKLIESLSARCRDPDRLNARVTLQIAWHCYPIFGTEGSYATFPDPKKSSEEPINDCLASQWRPARNNLSAASSRKLDGREDHKTLKPDQSCRVGLA